MSVEARARAELVAVARRLDAKGILTATDGNLSALLEDGSIVITPSGCCKGLVEEHELVRVRADGSADGRPSSELAMHRAIYAARSDVKAIVHAHPPHATAYAVAGLALDEPILSEAVLTLGSVPVVPYALPTAAALAEAVAPYAGNGRALLLRFHGAVTFAPSIREAAMLMETLEHVAHIDSIRRALGSADRIAPADVAALESLRHRLFGW